MTAYYFAFMIIIFGSYIVYEVEHKINAAHFSSLGESLWWGFVTFTTIGYGDKVPQSTAGKMVGALFSLFGCAIFALPAGIIATGLGLQVKENEKSRKITLSRNKAARLMWSLWRCCHHGDFIDMTSKEHNSVSTKLVSRSEQNAARFIRLLQYQVALGVFKRSKET